MIGTIVNVLAIVVGGLIGLLFKKVIKKEYCDRILKVIGIAILVVALVGAIKAMVKVNYDFSISTSHELLLIVILATGTLIGELLKIDDRLNSFVSKIENKFTKTENNSSTFSKGFISASLVACVGAMAIVGSINDALGDPSMLYIKSVIDFVTMIFFAATLGAGVIFSSITVLVYQGVITLLGYGLGNFINNEFIDMFSALGYTMVIIIAFNFICDTKIKVANTLPAILILVIYYLIKIWIF